MKRDSTPILVISATVLALATAWLWGLSPFRNWPVDILYNSDVAATEIVRKVMPYRLIQPERVVSPGDNHAQTILKWQVAEIRARLSLVLAVWTLAVILVFYRERRRGVGPKSANASYFGAGSGSGLG